MITAPLVVLGQILGVAFGAGLNLYATIAFLGLAIRLGWIAGLPPTLYGLSNPVVLVTAALLYIVEFFIDKIPYADSAWDAIHTIIRPVAVAVLVYAALGEASLPLQVGGATFAGLIALAAHGSKAGLRLILNVRPRKVRNVFISLLEDVCAVALAAAAVMYPIAALIVGAIGLPLVAWAGPRLWRAGVLALRALDARLRGFFGRKGWQDTNRLPTRMQRVVDVPNLGRPQPKMLRAALKGVKGVGSYKNGWIVVSDGAPVFIWQSLTGPRRLELPSITHAEVRRGIWTDTVEIVNGEGSCTVFLLKDGPPAHIALAELQGHSQ
ncbi:MAG TPA: DUF4126 domain-containing protein [Longimicrobiales bacterium]